MIETAEDGIAAELVELSREHPGLAKSKDMRAVRTSLLDYGHVAKAFDCEPINSIVAIGRHLKFREQSFGSHCSKYVDKKATPIGTGRALTSSKRFNHRWKRTEVFFRRQTPAGEKRPIMLERRDHARYLINDRLWRCASMPTRRSSFRAHDFLLPCYDRYRPRSLTRWQSPSVSGECFSDQSANPWGTW
jgi:hypothetical protein